VPRRRVDGVLLLDKPRGLSSNAALQRARRLFAAQKAGHTGTLDPLASGLLPLCFGEATKFAQALLEGSKEYVATIRFGRATTTGDAEGETLRECPVGFTRTDFEEALPRFLGRVLQVPPRHAALKHEGRSYYEYARAGVEIPRAAREVRVDALKIVEWVLPTAVLRVRCGKGTYIRTLAEDLATAVGSCAHLAALVRTASGPFALDAAVDLDRLEAIEPQARDALLLPVDALVAGLPRIELDAEKARALVEGRAVRDVAASTGRHRCYGPRGDFVGLGEVMADHSLRAVRLLRSDCMSAEREPAPPARGGPEPFSG
jgi:tRNA pseudouridine55 synthase